MKKLALILVAVLTMSMFTACGSKEAATEAPAETPAAVEETAEAEVATGKYTVYNVTGETVNELYLYETGADKGENLAADGLKDTKKVELTYVGTAETTLTLEYTTESGYNAKFETLHIEEAPIALQVVDAETGATPISFSVPEGTGKYQITNTTGETVTELYVYPVDGEKGENLAGEGMEDGAAVPVEYTGAIDSVLVVEFTTETDGTKAFETLHIEEANINLLAADAMTGATPIEFTF